MTDLRIRLLALAKQWEDDAEFIEGVASGTRIRRAVAAEVARACAFQLRETLNIEEPKVRNKRSTVYIDVRKILGKEKPHRVEPVGC